MSAPMLSPGSRNRASATGHPRQFNRHPQIVRILLARIDVIGQVRTERSKTSVDQRAGRVHGGSRFSMTLPLLVSGPLM